MGIRAFEGDLDVVTAIATVAEAVMAPIAVKVWFDSSNTPPPSLSL